MICSQIIVDEPTGKKYDCINGICVESAGGQYTEPTCAGACKKKGDSSMIIIAAVGLGLAYLMFGDKK